jgi:hypothetical protein
MLLFEDPGFHVMEGGAFQRDQVALHARLA